MTFQQAAKIQVPAFLAHGGRNTEVRIEAMRNLAKAIRAAGGR
jgi:dipeptidyl aminopeptidase/acylaminoacyl peptidase